MSKEINELNEKLLPIYSELVEACLEYTESKVDVVYILGMNEGNLCFMNDAFFKLKDVFYKKHKIGEVANIETTSEGREGLLRKLMTIREMYSLYKEYTDDVPREVRIKYNVNTGKFGVKLSYSRRVEESETLSVDDVYREWFAEVESGNDGFDW